jgi:hypothetical protein
MGADTDGGAATPPWWAKRVRHGSLLTKRLTHLLTIITAGLLWFLGDLYNVVLDYGAKAEAWFTEMCRRWGWGSDSPGLFEVLGWLDFIGDVGFFIAVGWSLLWIYSDAVCLAADSSMPLVARDAGQRSRSAFRIFLLNTLCAVAVAGASYFFAWQVIKDSGQLRGLLQPNHQADAAAERLKEPSNYVPSWGEVLWGGALVKPIEYTIDIFTASQRVDPPPIWVVEMAPEAKRLVYVISIAIMAVGSWWLLKNSIRPSG